MIPIYPERTNPLYILISRNIIKRRMLCQEQRHSKYLKYLILKPLLTNVSSFFNLETIKNLLPFHSKEKAMNIEAVIEIIKQEIREHVDTAVVGLSGGADSFLVMLLSAEALGKNNVYALSMPYSDLDTRTFNSLSTMYAEHIGVHHHVIGIGDIAQAINQAVSGAVSTPGENGISALNAGNARSRSRMCVLYGFAHHLNDRLKNRVRVMGTGNLSEDFIGYDTKGGDALADIFPIGQLFKSEVYKILEHFRDKGLITESMINRVPSAGLWENQTDEDELGHSYDAMEPAIRFILQSEGRFQESSLTDIQRFVWHRHLTNKHKHEAPYVVTLRDSRGNLIV